MKTLKKLDFENLSLFAGLIGFVVIFILLAVKFDGLSTFDFFFMLINSPDLIDIAAIAVPSLLFCVLVIINFILSLSLIALKLLKKVNSRLSFLGILGMILNSFCILLGIFVLEFTVAKSIVLPMIFEFLGLYGTYAAWRYICKNYNVECNEVQKNKILKICCCVELVFFMLPIMLFILILMVIMSNGGGIGRHRNLKSTTEFKYDKYKNTILVGNEEYSVKDNKLFDMKTKEEVGVLDKDTVIFYTK